MIHNDQQCATTNHNEPHSKTVGHNKIHEQSEPLWERMS